MLLPPSCGSSPSQTMDSGHMATLVNKWQRGGCLYPHEELQNLRFVYIVRSRGKTLCERMCIDWMIEPESDPT